MMGVRTEYVAFYVTPSVRQALRLEAQRCEQSQSKWMAALLLQRLRELGYVVSETE